MGVERRRLRDAGRPQPAAHRAAEAAALRRGVLARARRAAARDRRRDRGRPRRAGARRRGDEEPLPPMQVQFAGGHRIAVETEAVVKRESIWNTRRFADRDSAAALPRVPQPLARDGRLAAVGAVAARSCSARSDSPARRCRPPPPASAAMLFGLGVDGVVLLYVAHRLALAGGAGRRCRRRSQGRRRSMLLGMWTTAATFYGLMFVDFPEPAAARAAHRPQHGGVRHPDAGHGAGAAAAPARRRRTVPRAADAAPRGVDCQRRRARCWCRQRRPDRRAGRRRDAHPRQPDTRSPAIGDRRRTARSDASDRRSACRATSTSCSPKAPTLEPLLQTNERLGAALATGAPGSRVPAADAPAAFGRRAGRSARRRSRQSAVCRPMRSGRRSNGRAWPATSRPAPSSRSWRVCRRLLDPPRAPHVTTATSRTASAISSIGSSSDDARDRWSLADVSCFHPARRRPPRLQRDRQRRSIRRRR